MTKEELFESHYPKQQGIDLLHTINIVEIYNAGAEKGIIDWPASSHFVNAVGTIRRAQPNAYDMPPKAAIEFWKAVRYFESKGRTIDLNNENPALWISTESGSPRW